MKPPISVQLYSVREAAAVDFPGVLRQIADMGYVGVELAGLYDMPAEEVRALLDELGLVVSSTHGPLPTEENLDELVGLARVLGCKYQISGWGPPEFATVEETLRVAALAQTAAKLLAGAGLKYGVHNHYWEFDHTLDGRYPHDIFFEAAPDVFPQIDTYWVKVGGADPGAIVRKYLGRTPLLHIKDGPGVKEEPMTAVGKGIMDWPSTLSKLDGIEWLIVEIDRVDGDMIRAVADSYNFLVGNGYATGKK